MEIVLKRKILTSESTIGELYVNGVFECFILEDMDRGLDKSMSLAEIQSHKIHSKTAIPTGKYEVAITFSDRFKQYLPLVLGVPGYEGIRIHPGNTAADTEGCLLPGLEKQTNVVSKSKIAFSKLFAKLKAVEKKEKIFITITR
jgi:hypothetical protein